MTVVNCQNGLLFSGFSREVVVVMSFSTIAGNGLGLGVRVDFGAQNCQYTTKVDAR
jgi:hypothetical protein